MRYNLRTLLILAMVGPPVLVVILSFLVENDWSSLAALGLVFAWLVIFFSVNVDFPKAP
jgi:hypothetical protein